LRFPHRKEGILVSNVRKEELKEKEGKAQGRGELVGGKGGQGLRGRNPNYVYGAVRGKSSEGGVFGEKGRRVGKEGQEGGHKESDSRGRRRKGTIILRQISRNGESKNFKMLKQGKSKGKSRETGKRDKRKKPRSAARKTIWDKGRILKRKSKK